MKSQSIPSIMMPIAAVGFFCTLAIAQTTPPKYAVVDLGEVGSAGSAFFVANNGLTAGAAVNSSKRSHAAVWLSGLEFDMGTPALGGPSSAAYGINVNGQVVGTAQSTLANSEDFCAFNALGLTPSSTACVPFVWQNGLMTPLPTLGGPNGVANSINSQGQAAGWAETGLRDPNGACPVFQFEAVTWGKTGIKKLNPFPGDTDAVAWSINDSGQVVGASGICTGYNMNTTLYLLEQHPMLWIDGVAINLGTLGGQGTLAGNHACAINNRGQVVGHSDLLGDATFHGFLWNPDTGMQDIGTLPGDFASLAIGIGDQGAAVGASFDQNFNEKAILIVDGALTDLNTLVTSNPRQLFLVQANSINVKGEITGFAATSAGDIHGFLAIPADQSDNSSALEGAQMPALSLQTRSAMLRRLGIRAK